LCQPAFDLIDKPDFEKWPDGFHHEDQNRDQCAFGFFRAHVTAAEQETRRHSGKQRTGHPGGGMPGERGTKARGNVQAPAEDERLPAETLTGGLALPDQLLDLSLF